MPLESTFTSSRPPRARRRGRAATTSLTAVHITGQLRHPTRASAAANSRDQFASTECTDTTTGRPVDSGPQSRPGER